MKRAMSETERRRIKQLEYNKAHGITPRTIQKKIKDILGDIMKAETERGKKVLKLEIVAEDKPIAKIIKEKEIEMKEAAVKLDFELAALLRDEIVVLKKRLTAKVPERRFSSKN
jgi:excinuclease ABC subunit B